jgi:hypothetical protein
MNTRVSSITLCAVVLLSAPILLAVGSIHGNIGSKTPIWVNALGDDQGNGNAVSANVSGEYHINGLPGDRWYMHSHFGKFFLPDGADIVVRCRRELQGA